MTNKCGEIIKSERQGKRDGQRDRERKWALPSLCHCQVVSALPYQLLHFLLGKVLVVMLIWLGLLWLGIIVDTCWLSQLGILFGIVKSGRVVYQIFGKDRKIVGKS